MSDLGWQGMVFPEQYGGSGNGFLDLCVLLEEMGRALVPGPFMPTVVHVGRPILAAGTEEQKKEFLPKIARGEAILTLALTEASGGIEASDIDVRAVADREEFVIDGTKLFVPDANVADYFLCVTRTKDTSSKEDGITLFMVDAKTAGIQVDVLKTMTGEKLCEVLFSEVRVPRKNMLGELNKGWPIVQRILDEASIAECAWMIGGARWVMETTVAYAKQRVQFDVPIGSFQANKHKMANMSAEVEGGTSITLYAAWIASEGSPQIPVAASMAKAWCSDAYKHVTFEGVQIHGAIGFTWDYDMHLYFRRAKSSEVAFGDATYHRERLAQLLIESQVDL